MLEDGDNGVQIRIRRKQRNAVRGTAILVGQARAAHDLQLVKFQCIDRQIGQSVGAGNQAFVGFERQAEQQVTGDVQAAACGPSDRVGGAGKIMAAQAFAQDGIAARFDTDFQLDQRVFRQFGEIVQRGIR